jgi:hypothetical protein
MKLTNLTKGLVAATALTVASFGANATAISEVSIDVTGLAITLYDTTGTNVLEPTSPTNPNGDFEVNNVSLDFGGTSVSSTLNSVNHGEGFDDIITNPFEVLSVDLNSNQTSGLSSVDTNSSISGNFLLGGATGSTSGTTKAYGNDGGETNSQIVNNLETTFAFTAGSEAKAKISFSWLFDVYIAITDQGGSANADWGLTVTLRNDQCAVFCVPDLYKFDLASILGGNNSGTFNDVGDVLDITTATTVETSAFINLNENETYYLKISQQSNTFAASVPEPTSLAILGLGLLGLAGVSRRKA